MAFPTPQVMTKNYLATPKLLDLLEKRLGTLGRLISKYQTAVCEVELEKVVRQRHAGKVYRCEVNIDLGERLVRAEAVEETMENAIDRAKNELKIELTKVNTKGKTLARTGARKAKEMVRTPGARA